MTGPPGLSAVSIGTVALLAAVTAGAQPPSAEQRAFDALGRAIAGIEAATGRDVMIRSAREIRDAAEGTLSAFNTGARVRDATYARYQATLREVDALAVRCDNGYPCDTDARGNTGVVYFEYGNRMYDADKKLLEKEQEPKKSELQLIGTDSEDRLDKKICPWDAISMVEYEDALELSKLYYDPELISTEGGVYSIDDKGKEELEDRQMEGF